MLHGANAIGEQHGTLAGRDQHDGAEFWVLADYNLCRRCDDVCVAKPLLDIGDLGWLVQLGLDHRLSSISSRDSSADKSALVRQLAKHALSPIGCRLADAGHEPDNPVVTDDVIAPDRFTLYGAWVRQVWTLQNAIVSAMKTSVWIGWFCRSFAFLPTSAQPRRVTVRRGRGDTTKSQSNSSDRQPLAVRRVRYGQSHSSRMMAATRQGQPLARLKSRRKFDRLSRVTPPRPDLL